MRPGRDDLAGADSALAVCSVESTAPDGEFAACAIELPAEVRLMPAGTVRTRPHDGRESWRLDDVAGVVEATKAVGLPLVIDYEHQTEHAKADGQPAPAAGWITAVEGRADDIWAAVEWTDRAKAMITGREYRFLSPAFRYDPKTRAVRRIVMAGLTNDRAFADLQAFTKTEGTMNELARKLIGLLGLDEDADHAAIAAAVESLKAAGEASAKAVDTAKTTTEALGRVAKALDREADAESAIPSAPESRAFDALAGASRLL